MYQNKINLYALLWEKVHGRGYAIKAGALFD